MPFLEGLNQAHKGVVDMMTTPCTLLISVCLVLNKVTERDLSIGAILHTFVSEYEPKTKSLQNVFSVMNILGSRMYKGILLPAILNPVERDFFVAVFGVFLFEVFLCTITAYTSTILDTLQTVI